MQHSSLYTIAFAAVLCIVCSIVVASSAVGLKERQEHNQLIDQQKKVLTVVGLLPEGERLSDAEITQLFEQRLEPRIVALETGEYVEGLDPLTFDQRRAARDSATSHAAPANAARVRRVSDNALIYLLREGDKIVALVLPIEGMGLWSTLFGYVALEGDAQTVLGLTFYEHGETAGLGGEIDNSRWKALWPGRMVFDADWNPKITVIKGAAGAPTEDPYRVDGLSGATLTCNGVTNALHFWLGTAGFGPFLTRYRAQEGIQ